MAEKRMFSNKIVGSDPFKEMPLSAQALYFHLGMAADDEGFLNNAKSIQRSIMASDDDFKLLIAKNFVIPFPSGVVVIKHWLMQNRVQPSRLVPTQYYEEKELLETKQNGVYTLCRQNVDKMSTKCQQNVDDLSQRVVEVSLVECSLGECSVSSEDHADDTDAAAQRLYITLCNKYGQDYVNGKIERAKRYPGTSMETIAKWCEEDMKKRKNSFNNFPQRENDIAEIEKILLTGQA